MAERPIIFDGESVRAILAGRKTQTRRVVTPQPEMVTDRDIRPWEGDPACLLSLLRKEGKRLQYGDVGDRLWVREPCGANGSRGFTSRQECRLTLEVVSVRVERVQEITHGDALAEGVAYDVSKPDGSPLARFRARWDAINAKRGHPWESNPWVWVVEFKRV